MDKEMESLQYPIGRFVRPVEVSEEEISRAIVIISEFPDKIQRAVENLDDEQLDTPYRPDGWTIRQVVHHCADSHMNAYMRFKLALTEETPTIKPYAQTRWASLIDSQVLPPDISIVIIKGIHARWVTIMDGMSDEEWDRRLIHPDQGAAQSLKQVVRMYEWHSEHHLAHVTGLIERMNW